MKTRSAVLATSWNIIYFIQLNVYFNVTKLFLLLFFIFSLSCIITLVCICVFWIDSTEWLMNLSQNTLAFNWTHSLWDQAYFSPNNVWLYAFGYLRLALFVPTVHDPSGETRHNDLHFLHAECWFAQAANRLVHQWMSKHRWLDVQ